MKIFLDIIYIYIFIYSVYFVLITLKSLRNKKFRILRKYHNTIPKKNLCLIIYTHNNAKKLARMLECIKTQDYPAENTSVFVILDNCDDNSEKINFAPNVQKFIIKNQPYIGKKQAISILVDKLSEYSMIDSYVFLDINRYIENNFLSSINAALEGNSVVSGSTLLFGERLTLRQRIKSAYQKYRMNFLERARACADLFTVVDSSVCAIKKSLVDVVGIPDFESLEKDLEYSLLIAQKGSKFTFNPDVKTYAEVREYKVRIPRLSKRVSLFINNINGLISTNFNFFEFTLFQLCPNILSIILIFALLFSIPLDYCFVADFTVLVGLLCALLFAFAISILTSKMRAREVLALMLYPVYSAFHFVKHFFLWRLIKAIVFKEKILYTDEKNYEIDVEITDGRGVAPCKLEIITECGMVKVRLLFKNKKITTKTHLRIFDAVDDLIKKLAEYGYTLKICQACSNFSSNHDGSTNLIKGFCKKQFQMSQDGEIPVVIWYSCRGYTPKVVVKNYRE